MGAQESKFEEALEDPQIPDKVPEGKCQKNDAPSTPISSPLDPRSPSANIVRTPLELILRNKMKITDEAANSPKIVLGVDPRSPTTDFERTPIVVSVVRNKKLDDVRKMQAVEVPSGEKSRIVPPKLLESSPITRPIVPIDVNKRRSFVGLLETNIDFRETDLDTVAVLNKTLPPDLRAESVTPITNKLKEQVSTMQTENFNDDEEVAESTVTKTEEKSINITAHVKELDKKLTHLIYEDCNGNTKKSVGRMKNRNRTPLSERNSNSEPKKSNKLKVSDKPKKQDLSKIPVLQKKKLEFQCENTPPLQTKPSEWDTDKTLII